MRETGQLFVLFIRIVQRQISPELVPRRLRWLLPVIERTAGWNLIIKASRPKGLHYDRRSADL